MFIAGNYDVIVIGAGHAGVEAALASARMGCQTLLTTLNMDNIAMMPCNPSVGGPAKGHLVREIDALGGEMGVNADKTCIQYRMLNTGKGPAVQALRAQADKKLYQNMMKKTCELQENLDVKQLLIDEILFEDNTVTGVVVETGEIYTCKAIVLASGTYLKGRIIIGENTYSGGPNGQRAAVKLSDCLKNAGIEIMRFKTGTPARVDRRSLDFSKMIIQPGDDRVHNFSFMSDVKTRDQVPCWLTYTNEQTHKIIRDNIERAPMANGIIKGIGPRYCPSIETKIVRFPDKQRHQQAHNAVQPVKRSEMRHQRGGQNCRRRDDIIARVCRRSHQGVGVDELAHLMVEAAHPQLDQDGRHQNRCRQPAELHRRGGNDFGKALLSQLDADDQDHD